LIVLAAALYTLGWIVYHVINNFLHLSTTGALDAKITIAIRMAYDAAPYSFIVGGIALMIAFQLLSLGTIALQNERYFNELFHFDTTLFRELKQDRQDVRGRGGCPRAATSSVRTLNRHGIGDGFGRLDP